MCRPIVPDVSNDVPQVSIDHVHQWLILVILNRYREKGRQGRSMGMAHPEMSAKPTQEADTSGTLRRSRPVVHGLVVPDQHACNRVARNEYACLAIKSDMSRIGRGPANRHPRTTSSRGTGTPMIVVDEHVTTSGKHFAGLQHRDLRREARGHAAVPREQDGRRRPSGATFCDTSVSAQPSKHAVTNARQTTVNRKRDAVRAT